MIDNIDTEAFFLSMKPRRGAKSLRQHTEARVEVQERNRLPYNERIVCDSPLVI